MLTVLFGRCMFKMFLNLLLSLNRGEINSNHIQFWHLESLLLFLTRVMIYVRIVISLIWPFQRELAVTIQFLLINCFKLYLYTVILRYFLKHGTVIHVLVQFLQLLLSIVNYYIMSYTLAFSNILDICDPKFLIIWIIFSPLYTVFLVLSWYRSLLFG